MFKPRAELFLVSFLVMFLELACIRWFPAHVLYLTFFTNTVLIASFLGMSVGCLAASRPRNYLKGTPILLFLAVACGQWVESARTAVEGAVDVGHQASPQMVYFGTEYRVHDLAHFAVPVEVLCGVSFLLLALVMLGPGQELGRCLNRVPGRVQAYTLNILGGLAGIAVCFDREGAPDLAFGANIAGAILGGLSEYASMLVGFRYLMLLAIGFYAVSAWLRPRERVDAKPLDKACPIP